ncbi:hypothetical protein ISU10_12025 [Nocardioides agariphilus]|jgi:hypothetical protein|uniref:Uncharacterized protein n=1 Tax=Nocardioides agariphilus TaxID=433664 RepID=A0A930YIV4_9ACTN|nr:hypothetical protein [Nocardioides agariphilus]MBF4768493.1 hypothetical protein [Nocardioides agariphilus]
MAGQPAGVSSAAPCRPAVDGAREERPSGGAKDGTCGARVRTSFHDDDNDGTYDRKLVLVVPLVF